MKYVFFGSPDFAAIVLKHLIEGGLPPTAVICNPDRPVGRKHIVTPPPVKREIETYEIRSKNKIAILQPETLTSYLLALKSLAPDFAVVAAYAKIIPQSVLDMPRLGTIGVHPSLLPKYRGASPIQSAILGGEAETGVTLYLMDDKIDHGPILGQMTWDMGQDDTYETLEKKLAELGGKLLLETIPKFLRGEITPKPQDHAKATFTKKFRTEDGLVDLKTDNDEMIFHKIRALNPEPGVYTFSYPGAKGVRVKLLSARFEHGKLILTKIQNEGGKPGRLA